jgi:hypothetical protein
MTDLSNIELDQQITDDADQQPRKHRAAASTVEALMYGLRKRRLAALKEPETMRCLAELSEAQLIEVVERLQRLKPHIARLWSEQEIAQLIIASSRC